MTPLYVQRALLEDTLQAAPVSAFFAPVGLRLLLIETRAFDVLRVLIVSLAVLKVVRPVLLVLRPGLALIPALTAALANFLPQVQVPALVAQ